MTTQEVDQRTSHIGSTVFPQEMELWLQYLEDEGTILDVGTGWGRSACCLGMIAPHAKIRTIDWGDEYINQNRTEEEYIKEVKSNIKKSGVDNVDFAMTRYENYFINYELNALNVDISANYEPYKGALLKFGKWVKPGGYIFIHSYVHPKTDEPRKAVHEVMKELLKMKIIRISKPINLPQGTLKSAVFKKL